MFDFTNTKKDEPEDKQAAFEEARAAFMAAHEAFHGPNAPRYGTPERRAASKRLHELEDAAYAAAKTAGIKVPRRGR